MRSEKVIIFPKWQKALEEDSIAAIKKRRFEEALEKLNELLNYEVKNHEIYTGKLICLMELERFDEAQNLCESLIADRGPHYYEYIHIYLTLLFQTNQYDLLMEIVSNELDEGDVPSPLCEPFEELYSMSKKMQEDMNDNHYHLYLEDLFDAVNQENHREQWNLLHKLRKLNVIPNEKVVSLLVNEVVHPLNKSAIYIWMQEQKIKEKTDIHKFGVKLKLKPVDSPPMRNNEVVNNIYKNLRELEQRNPSLYKFIENLLEHYLYVLYPIIPDKKDTASIAEALIAVGQEYINPITGVKEYSEKVRRYIQEVKTCSILYSSILEE